MSEKLETELTDEYFMREALRLAKLAEEIDEVPVGALIVKDGKILARAYNTRETSKCATHHAEVLAIEECCRVMGGWRLPGVTLYVTMEPCAMCAGAIINARIPRVVYGAQDIRFGAFGSALDLNSVGLNHRPEVVGGVLGDEARQMLTDYFRAKRKKNGSSPDKYPEFSDAFRAALLPEDSYSDLFSAYGRVVENEEAKLLFKQAVDSLLVPNEVVYNDLTKKITEIVAVHPYTLDAVLCISAIEPLRKIFAEAGREKDLPSLVAGFKANLLECRKTDGVWGVMEGFWQWMFHELYCVRLGRLEFEPYHHQLDIPYGKIQKGDPVILIHIPRGDSLDMEEVEASLKMGYERYKDRFAEGVVPFMTHSWLIYPPYMNGVFKEGGNIQRFAEMFDIIAEDAQNYINFRNIFGFSYSGEELDSIPAKTSLQRNVLEFLKRGGVMGQGYGIFLYGKDGRIKG